MSKHKFSQQAQGFTLIEVLIAIIITTLFISISMQAVVLAAVFKARARQYAEATTWIQEDLEKVKYKGNQYPVVNAKCSANSSDNGYADGLRDLVVGTDQTGSYSDNFSRTITNKPFTLRRTTTPSDNLPYNVLQVKYDVFPTLSGLSVAKFETEVIPDAAFKCP